MTDDSSNWRKWSLAEREREYSPSTCVAAIEPFLDEYVARSRDAETRFRCQKNMLWGDRPDEVFDYSQRHPRMRLCWFTSTGVTGRSTRRTNRFLQRRIASRMELRLLRLITLWRHGPASDSS